MCPTGIPRITLKFTVFSKSAPLEFEALSRRCTTVFNLIYRLNAPIIISNAGAYNTFQKLLPCEISQKSYYTELLKNMEPGAAALSIFVGMDASHDKLGLKAQNTWAFTSNSWSEINISCLSMHTYLIQI